MIKKTRFDGKLIKDLPPFNRFMPYLMKDKAGSVIYYEQDLDVTKALADIKEINRELIKERTLITLFGVVVAAAARTLSQRPKLNRFISGYRYWQRNDIQITFVAKKEITDDGKEVNVKITFAPDETLASAAKKIHTEVKKAVSEDGAENEKVVDTIMKLPSFMVKILVKAMNFLDQHNLMARSLIESDPMWCSVFMTNVGSFGLDAPFHHLFERGNCPVFVSVGKVREEFKMNEKGEVEKKSMLRLRYTFDDRIADGVYMGRALDLMRSYIENPSLLLSSV
jgi:pyruvate/2-oxoglutarate dehydrogenase complex dihydrolipoamide acyltransferase (E2) component